MRGNFDKLRIGLLAAAILLIVSACHPEKPTAKDGGSDAVSLIARWRSLYSACKEAGSSEDASECKNREVTEAQLAALNYCDGVQVFTSGINRHWAKCTAPLPIEMLERKWRSIYEICDHALYGPARDKACSDEEVFSEELNDNGYCYKEFVSDHATEDWLPCKVRHKKLTGRAKIIYHLKKDWIVQDTNCTDASDQSFADKACSIRDNDLVHFTKLGLCLKKINNETTWADCDGRAKR